MKWARRFRKAGRGGSLPGERVSWLGLFVIVLVMFGIGFLYAYPRLREPPLVRRDFVGRVVDKSLTLHESQIGTSGSLALLVEGRDGKRFKVAVTDEVYGRARVGMWVSRRAGAVEVSWGEPEPVPTREEGGKVEGR